MHLFCVIIIHCNMPLSVDKYKCTCLLDAQECCLPKIKRFLSEAEGRNLHSGCHL